MSKKFIRIEVPAGNISSMNKAVVEHSEMEIEEMMEILGGLMTEVCKKVVAKYNFSEKSEDEFLERARLVTWGYARDVKDNYEAYRNKLAEIDNDFKKSQK